MNKIQLNEKQIALAKSWLPNGSQPYAHNTKLLWFRDDQGRKNAVNLTPIQSQQLNQLS
jgi:hypothetical protein